MKKFDLNTLTIEELIQLRKEALRVKWEKEAKEKETIEQELNSFLE